MDFFLQIVLHNFPQQNKDKDVFQALAHHFIRNIKF